MFLILVSWKHFTSNSSEKIVTNENTYSNLILHFIHYSYVVRNDKKWVRTPKINVSCNCFQFRHFTLIGYTKLSNLRVTEFSDMYLKRFIIFIFTFSPSSPCSFRMHNEQNVSFIIWADLLLSFPFLDCQ